MRFTSSERKSVVTGFAIGGVAGYYVANKSPMPDAPSGVYGSSILTFGLLGAGFGLMLANV